jgi:hypothetical protein
MRHRILFAATAIAIATLGLATATPTAAQAPSVRCDFTDIDPQTNAPCIAIGKFSSPGGLVASFTSDIPVAVRSS